MGGNGILDRNEFALAQRAITALQEYTDALKQHSDAVHDLADTGRPGGAVDPKYVVELNAQPEAADADEDRWVADVTCITPSGDTETSTARRLAVETVYGPRGWDALNGDEGYRMATGDGFVYYVTAGDVEQVRDLTTSDG